MSFFFLKKGYYSKPPKLCPSLWFPKDVRWGRVQSQGWVTWCVYAVARCSLQLASLIHSSACMMNLWHNDDVLAVNSSKCMLSGSGLRAAGAAGGQQNIHKGRRMSGLAEGPATVSPPRWPGRRNWSGTHPPPCFYNRPGLARCIITTHMSWDGTERRFPAATGTHGRAIAITQAQMTMSFHGANVERMAEPGTLTFLATIKIQPVRKTSG